MKAQNDEGYLMGRRILTAFVFVACNIYSSSVLAEPTTIPVKIIEIRPYNVQGAPGSVYVRIDQVSLCNTDTYRIDLSWSGSKEILATALAAFMADKPVKVEVANSGCVGFATPIQSLYLVKQ